MKMRRRIGIALAVSLAVTISPTTAVPQRTISTATAQEVAPGLSYTLANFESVYGRYQYDWDNARNLAGFDAGSDAKLVKAGQRVTVDLTYENEYRNPSNVIPEGVTFSLNDVPEGWDATVNPTTGQLSIAATNTDPATAEPARIRVDATLPDGERAGAAFANFALATQSSAYSHLVVEPSDETPFEPGESRTYTVKISREWSEDQKLEPIPANAELTVDAALLGEGGGWKIEVNRQNGTFRVTAPRGSDVWPDPLSLDELLGVTVTFPDRSTINEVIKVIVARDSTRADVVYPETLDRSALGVEQTIYPSIQRISGPDNPVKPVEYELLDNLDDVSIDSRTGAITYTPDPDAAPGDMVLNVTIDVTFPDSSTRRTSAVVTLPKGKNSFLYPRSLYLLGDPVEAEPFVIPRGYEHPTPLESLTWALKDPANAIAGAAINAKTGQFTAPGPKKSGYYGERVNLYVDGQLDSDGLVTWETLDRLDARAFRYRYEDNEGSPRTGLTIPQSVRLGHVSRYVTVTGSSIDTSLITVTKGGLEIKPPANASELAGKEQWVDVRIAIPGEPVQTQRVPFSFYRSLFGFPVAIGVKADSKPSTFTSEFAELELESKHLMLDTSELPDGLTATLDDGKLTVSASENVEPGAYTFGIRINSATLPPEDKIDEALLEQLVETVAVNVTRPATTPPATTPAPATSAPSPAKPTPTEAPVKPEPTSAQATPTSTTATSALTTAESSQPDAPETTDSVETSETAQPSTPAPTTADQNEPKADEDTMEIWKILMIVVGVTTAVFGSFGAALMVVPGLKDQVNSLLKPTGFQIP